MDRSMADRAHRAMPDAYVTTHLLREILKHASIQELIRWTNEPVLLPRVLFGKHRGQKWTDVPPDYLQWILRQSDNRSTGADGQPRCEYQSGRVAPKRQLYG
jgi:exodeoxyribonuclease X